MKQQQQNIILTRKPSRELPFLVSRSRRSVVTAGLVIFAFVALIVINRNDGSSGGSTLRSKPSMENGARYASGTAPREVNQVEKSFSSDVKSSEAIVEEDHIEEGEDDETHPWSWIGFLDKLANKDTDFITSALKDYADDKTYYKSPGDFLKGCNAKELPDGRCGFLGGPEEKFTAMSPHVMKVLRHLGMTNSSRVLEVGVGLGRNAQSLIEFLDEDKYCGIEPNGDMLAVGVAHMVGKKAMDEKRPMFSTNSDFDFGVFFRGESGDKKLFDVVTSRSVWSHTSKIQNEQYLASFAKYTNPTAFLATSVIKVTEDCSKDYNGTEWVGKSHDANNEGIVIHCMPWIREACAKVGLVAKSLTEEAPELMVGVGTERWNDLGQPWIVIRHDPSKSKSVN